ncbi:MAG: Hsp70 family protein [Sporichthyaceae bacterium]
MSYRLGIELGRTRTVAVVVHDGQAPRPLPLGGSGPHGAVAAMPTALFLERRGAISCGRRATELAVVEPERLLVGFLDRIGSGEPLRIGSGSDATTHHAQDVAAAVVAWVIAHAGELEGAPPAAVAVALPADLGDRRTTEPFKKALAAQRLDHVLLVEEYFAAGRLYTHALKPSPGQAFATFVVGASGVRAAVLRGDLDGNVWPLGRPAARADVGGDAFDAAVLHRVLAEVGVSAEHVTANASDAAALRGACRRLREQLSTEESAELGIALRDRVAPATLSREEFEAQIRGAVAAGADLLDEVVADAGIRREDVAAILLCGDAAATPAIARELGARFGADVHLVREPDPSLTVAAGAALGLPAPAAPTAAPEPAAPPAQKTRTLRPALASAVRAEGAPRLRPPATTPARQAPAGNRGPVQQPTVGTGRPIRPNEPKGAPRRNQVALLGLDSGARTTPRYATGSLSVVPGRELGTVEDLLEVPGPRRIAAARELEARTEAQFSEVDGHEVDERTLGQRARSMMTPTRVLALGALTTAVFVGSNAWLHVQ